MSVDSGMGNYAGDADLEAIENETLPGTSNVQKVIGSLRSRLAQDNPTNTDTNINKTERVDVNAPPQGQNPLDMSLEDGGPQLDEGFSTVMDNKVPTRLQSVIRLADDMPGTAPMMPNMQQDPSPASVTAPAGVPTDNPTANPSTVTSSFNPIAYVIENGEVKCASCETYYIPKSEHHVKSAHCGAPECHDKRQEEDMDGVEGVWVASKFATYPPQGDNPVEEEREYARQLMEGESSEFGLGEGDDEAVFNPLTPRRDTLRIPMQPGELKLDEEPEWEPENPRRHPIVENLIERIKHHSSKLPSDAEEGDVIRGKMIKTTDEETRLASTDDYLAAFNKVASDSQLYYRGYEDAKAGRPLDEDLAELSDDYFHGYDQFKFYHIGPQQSVPQSLYDIKPNSNNNPRMTQGEVDRGPNQLTDGHSFATHASNDNLKEAFGDPLGFAHALQQSNQVKREREENLLINMALMGPSEKKIDEVHKQTCKLCDQLGHTNNHSEHSVPAGASENQQLPIGVLSSRLPFPPDIIQNFFED